MSTTHAARYLNKPARLCPNCGGNQVAVMPNGGIRCRACREIAEEPEAILVAVEDETGKFYWREHGGLDSEPAEPLLRRKSEPTEFHQPDHTGDVYVSTRLDSFTLEPPTDLQEFEDWEAEQVYRKLDEIYLGWLYSRVRRLPDPQREEAMDALWECVVVALNLGAIPARLAEQDAWPATPPNWYSGPGECGEFARRNGLDF